MVSNEINVCGNYFSIKPATVVQVSIVESSKRYNYIYSVIKSNEIYQKLNADFMMNKIKKI